MVARNSIPGVWRSPIGVVVCFEPIFDIVNSQILSRAANIRETNVIYKKIEES